MADYKYIIVGAGVAGASAVEGIREQDKNGSILLVGAEDALPYNRPPLTKGLWSGDEKVSDIPVHDEAYYQDGGVEFLRGARVESINPSDKKIRTAEGTEHTYDALLLATGGSPRRLNIPGANAHGMLYYRTLADYEEIRPQATEGKTAVVIGGGFIGSEIAAALCMAGVKVTMVFPASYIVDRVFPEDLGRALQSAYTDKGITFLTGDSPSTVQHKSDGFLTGTNGGRWLKSDILVIGIGILPGTQLAEAAGLDTEIGITVNEFLQTSDPNIYAAGDNANFPYAALRKRTRVEHWDNAVFQGKQAGRNMAGAREPYTHMPFFYSDLFEFGYEAVGEVDSRLETFADWQEPFKTGVIYYLKDNRVRGAMMCNVWEKVPEARDLIRADKPVATADLKGRITGD